MPGDARLELDSPCRKVAVRIAFGPKALSELLITKADNKKILSGCNCIRKIMLVHIYKMQLDNDYDTEIVLATSIPCSMLFT